MKKKTLTIAIALVLVVALAVGATYAYLTASSGPVKNTFVVGGAVANGDLKLFEHVANKNADGSYTLGSDTTTSNAYTVMPGVNLPKDPTVTVEKASGEYYLFVEVTKGSGFASVTVGEGDNAKTGTPLSCNVDTANWQPLTLPGKDANREVYVYCVTGKSAIQSAPVENVAVLKTIGDTQNTITVSDDNDIVATLTNDSASALTFKAYACQAAGFADAAAAFTACFGTK